MPSVKKQIGSGFTFNQSDVIGGQMSRVGYSECDTPSYYNKYMVYDTAAPAAPVAVQQSAGARKSKSKRSRKISKSKSKSVKHVRESKKRSKSVKRERESKKRSKSVKRQRESRKRSKSSNSKKRL
jgi:hypothetical protein